MKTEKRYQLQMMCEIKEFSGSDCCLDAASFDLCSVGIKSDGFIIAGDSVPDSPLYIPSAIRNTISLLSLISLRNNVVISISKFS